MNLSAVVCNFFHNYKDFSKTEIETIDFSKPEPEFEYFSNSKAIETNNLL